MKKISERLREAMEIREIKQNELAEKADINKGALSCWLNGKYEPKQKSIYKLANALDVSELWLMGVDGAPMERGYQYTLGDVTGDMTFNPSAGQDESDAYEYLLCEEEASLIEKYRALDSHGKRVMDAVLDVEHERCTSTATSRKPYIYIHKIAAAGESFLTDDIPIDIIEADYVPNADFIIGVDGDSMEPTFHDGDMVYVKKQSGINIGDIGIFTMGNSCYIKELGKDGLISHNPKYKTIKGNSDIRCVGKVIGKVEE